MVPGGRLVVLGKQGAGKGTQCVRLSHHYVIPHISTGDMLRGETKAGTELGLEAQRYMDSGELIPDEIVLKMVGDKEVRVPANTVAALVPQQKSLMPELLLRDVTLEQAADLLEFLAGLK